MLRAAGADSPPSGFDGYRPLSAEAGAASEVEAIVMMEHSLAEAGGVDAVLNVPALAVSRAATARRVLAVEGS
jgi:iron complex transport system substrate-binding protein